MHFQFKHSFHLQLDVTTHAGALFCFFGAIVCRPPPPLVWISVQGWMKDKSGRYADRWRANRACALKMEIKKKQTKWGIQLCTTTTTTSSTTILTRLSLVSLVSSERTFADPARSILHYTSVASHPWPARTTSKRERETVAFKRGGA
jgi:hypothetical protein